MVSFSIFLIYYHFSLSFINAQMKCHLSFQSFSFLFCYLHFNITCSACLSKLLMVHLCSEGYTVNSFLEKSILSTLQLYVGIMCSHNANQKVFYSLNLNSIRYGGTCTFKGKVHFFSSIYLFFYLDAKIAPFKEKKRFEWLDEAENSFAHKN